ncbi:hypothetical protein L1049_022008 [Liquidambar formosana]|uniref:Phosphoenolpyruvate carboxylase n=1 Tax=Liquidambar formosana TaxID=63359 RepID=A0AAP0RDJ4_LIQFO
MVEVVLSEEEVVPPILLYCLNHRKLFMGHSVLLFKVKLLRNRLERSICVLERSSVSQLLHLSTHALMDEMAVIAMEECRSIVFQESQFVEYFRLISIQQRIMSLCCSLMAYKLSSAFFNIIILILLMIVGYYTRVGVWLDEHRSRPSKRKPSGGIESLRAIPWIFAWTQTRSHLLVWLGFGAAFKHVIEDIRNLHMLQKMYNNWPFFRVTINLVEMVFAKGDPGIAALYDKLLVLEDLWSFGE